eukprot:7386131-Prymnesium_polylepis.1
MGANLGGATTADAFALLRKADARHAAQLLAGVDTSVLPDDAVCEGLLDFAKLQRASAPRRAPVHQLVLRSAAQRSSAGFLRRSGRLSSLANTTSIFHMTHIAKTGGRSVKLELNRLVRASKNVSQHTTRNAGTFGPHAAGASRLRRGAAHPPIVKPVGGAEQCHAPFVHESRVSVIFFREPRGHVLSQYLHAAYAGRATARRARGLPVVKGDDLAGFGQWVRHYAEGWTPAKGDFGGYNPMNMMARALTCRDEHWNCDYLKARRSCRRAAGLVRRSHARRAPTPGRSATSRARTTSARERRTRRRPWMWR